MKRIMGLDFGSKTVGVAVSDPLYLTAQGICTIHRDRESKLRRTLSRIEELIVEYDVGLIVMGLPLNMDGSEGERAELTRAFAADLERRTGLRVILQDERLTTIEAHERLDEARVDRERQKEVVDTMAAMIILGEYMDKAKETPGSV